MKKQLSLRPLSAPILGQVKLLTSQCFPVAYKESFYDSLLYDEKKIVRLAYISDILVGIVACKFVDEQLYIMLLGVLPAYRRLGIASQLLAIVYGVGVYPIVLHVQTDNKGGLEFYAKENFEILDTVPDYYPQLEPSSAHYLCRTSP